MSKKLRPTIGDVWDLHYAANTVIRYELTNRYHGDSWFGWRNDDKTREACLDVESKMISDDRFVLVRPAGCPEGLVACSRGCGRWTKKYAHERGDWCFTCLGNTDREARAQDWTPPAERRIVEPAVPPPPPNPTGCPAGFVPCDRGCGKWTKDQSHTGSSLGKTCYRCCGFPAESQHACTDWTPPAERIVGAPAVSPPPAPPALTGDISVPSASDRLAARLNELESDSKTFQRAQYAVNDSVTDRLSAFDLRIKALEARLAPAAPCSGLCCNPVPPPPKPQPCWAVGPGNSRCLRDRHGDDGHHRFGLTLVRS